ncbi:YoaK family protein [Prosthecobacter sp.]|uniref:YoaK family protein n=1 Tax=Prosthecobacter sp. TaxID=1965333 RepID=UPI002488FAE3|nr:YoaK family protein [Prosthecobacter sp.]MDI1313828.1 YoaK family protein [Prosthecobacter sp.]
MVNVIDLLGFEHRAITHLMGNTSMLAAALAELDLAAALPLVAIIGAFMAGTVLSGFIIQESTLRLGDRYWVTLLLCLAVHLLQRSSVLGLCAAACACGLQNAMVSTCSGTDIRTTELSGMFTDLGIFLGHFLRGLPVDVRRLRLCLLIISAFLCGGIAGAVAFRRLDYTTLYIPSVLIALMALAYSLYRFRQNRRA